MPYPSDNPYQEEQDDYAVSPEAWEQWGEIHLDGLPIPVLGEVGETDLQVFQPKITIGDATKDSDQILSVWVQSDYTGGGQVYDINEGSDLQRFYYSTAETRYPNMLTLPPETVEVSYTLELGGVPVVATPVGDYFVGAERLFWVAFDTDLTYWDATAQEYVYVTDLTAVPVGKGVVYEDELWIPLGSSGYDCFDGLVITNHTDSLAISIVEWDDKLLLLGTDSVVSRWDGVAMDAPDGWRLRGDRVPRHLVVWWSPERFPTVFVVTNRDVWAIDPLVETLYLTGLHFPIHPDQGLGACAWRDDAMYVSVGVGIHQLSLGNVISTNGLDRDDGLPAEFRGVIVDLEGEYNGILALIQGVATTVVGGGDTSGFDIEETMLFEESLVVPESSSFAKSTLQRFTGIGWHTVWESEGADGVPSRVMISEASDEYKMWWGYAGKMYFQVLRRTFHNPKQGMQMGIDRFAPSAVHRSGRFDANMEGFSKLLAHLEVYLDHASKQTVEIWYRTNQSIDLLYLGTVTGMGKRVLAFDPNEDGFSEGLPVEWIEFEYHLSSTDPLETPVIRWMSLKFIKLPLQTKSFRFTVPLVFPEQWNGRGAKEITDHLSALASGNRFVTFKHRHDTYRVWVAQTQGSGSTGDNLSSSRIVSLIEIVLPESEVG